MTTPKFEKAAALLVLRVSSLRPRWSTKAAIRIYSRWGMKFDGTPNYISSSAWFDGADYSLITLGEGCTISSRTSFLTHDWTVYNVGRALGDIDTPKQSINRPIGIGSYSFIGRGSTIMPGSTVGHGAVIGAGTVVRGEVPDYAIFAGNPGQVVGDARDHHAKHRHRLADS